MKEEISTELIDWENGVPFFYDVAPMGKYKPGKVYAIEGQKWSCRSIRKESDELRKVFFDREWD